MRRYKIYTMQKYQDIITVRNSKLILAQVATLLSIELK